ncbi:RNA methyltransferase [Patescibacteria group bacterium]|nr:RNA methyltransferase [Patescibacteria group bacterium]MBU4580083.1 RNA methyltransferase [Patescibacteria group bacterium]
MKAKALEITSKDNAKIRILKQLGQKKYRDESGKFLAENAVIISDALKAGIVFDAIFVTKDFIEKNKEKFDFIIANSKAREYYLIDEKINKSFSSLDTAPGIAAVYSKLERKIDFAKPIIYLNAINDPGNLGTIFRSALAFGLKNIVVDEHSADIYNPKTINAAKDAIFKLNIVFDKDLGILKEIKRKMPIFTTRLEKSKGLEILKKEKLFCVALGSESHGADKAIREMSDGFIRIPMSSEIESLNVAASAAIIFYEIYCS